jgi:putative transposase
LICCADQPFNEKKDKTKVRDIRIVPMGTSFVVELVYDKYIDHDVNTDHDRVASIDMGVNSLMAIATNQPDVSPVLVNGKTLKSINAKWNKDKSKLQTYDKKGHISSKVVKRHNKIRDYFHKNFKVVD